MVSISKSFIPAEKKESTYKIGILARLSKEKNHQLFIKIANVLKKEMTFVLYCW